MDDQLNNDLKNRIKEVFDHYEAPQEEADLGWTELRKKFPEKEKRNLAAWLWSSAAVLLILLLFGLWFNRLSKPDSATYTRTRIKEKAPVKSIPADTASAPGQASTIYSLNSTTGNVYNNKTLQPSAYPTATVPQVNAPESSITDKTTTALAATVQPSDAHKNATDTATANLPTEKSDKTPIALAQSANQAKARKDSAAQQSPASGMDRLFALEAKSKQWPEKETATNKDKRVNFAVYAATYLNYAKGSSNQVNAGAGVSSDIKLAKRLKLVTGVAITQNSLSYNSEPTQPNLYAAALAATGKTTPMMGNLFASVTATSASASVTELKGYNVSFSGIDVPLNIKYELSAKRTDTYILAGLSSSTFFNEAYHYTYTNSSATGSTQSADTQAKFSTFDIAKTLNVAVGIGTPLGKKNVLIIEPFLKYPLDGLGSQQIRFGASGINLKLRLGSH